MDFLQTGGGADSQKTSFFSHVFSTTEEGKGEILNVGQYALMGVIPVVILNKLIQQFIPEADHGKSTIELTIEIAIQIIVMFCGMLLIHRTITYFPTYSGFNYENMNLTNVALAFLIIVLSIQTKLGIKVNILYDRLMELWNGPSSNQGKANGRNKMRVTPGMMSHVPSQADHLDSPPVQTDMFPPAPVATAVKQSSGSYDMSMRGNPAPPVSSGPMAANSLLGGAFGALF